MTTTTMGKICHGKPESSEINDEHFEKFLITEER